MTTDAKDARIAELVVALGEVKALLCSASNDGKTPAVKEANANAAWHVCDRALAGDGSAGAKVIQAAVNWKYGRGENSRGALVLAIEAYLAALDKED